VNWYIVTNGGIPAVTCDEFKEQDCPNNEDLIFTEEDVQCLEPSSAPSAMPSESPSDSPTWSPTLTPTEG
jgi:hypothetical protein